MGCKWKLNTDPYSSRECHASLSQCHIIIDRALIPILKTGQPFEVQFLQIWSQVSSETLRNTRIREGFLFNFMNNRIDEIRLFEDSNAVLRFYQQVNLTYLLSPRFVSTQYDIPKTS